MRVGSHLSDPSMLPFFLHATKPIFYLSTSKSLMKIFLFTSCMFLTVFSFGQKHSVSINYKPSLTYFGKQSQPFNHYYFASRKGDQTFNSSANILYTYNLSSRLSVTSGVEYSQQGQNINFNADSAFPSTNRQMLEIELVILEFR